MSHRHSLVLLGLMLIAIGLFEHGWLLLAIWLGGDFLALGIAHARGFHRVLGKRPDGSLPFWSWLIFLPYLLYMGVVWHTIRLFSREPAQNEVTEHLVIGRRLLASEIKEGFVNYIDLTAEFPEPKAIRTSPSYFSFPILDGAAPDSCAMDDAVKRLRPGRTFVHCAQGHGRTGLFTLALMLRTGHAKTVSEGLQILRAVRPGVRLSSAQQRCIEEFAKTK